MEGHREDSVVAVVDVVVVDEVDRYRVCVRGEEMTRGETAVCVKGKSHHRKDSVQIQISYQYRISPANLQISPSRQSDEITPSHISVNLDGLRYLSSTPR